MKEVVITNAGLGMGFSTHAQSAAMRFIGIKARSKRARKEEYEGGGGEGKKSSNPPRNAESSTHSEV